MSERKRAAINVLLVSLILIHAAYLVTGHQHWPFLGYPMFSWVRGNFLVDNLTLGDARAVECLLVYGRPRDPSLDEIPLRGPEISPLGAIRVRYALQKIRTHPHRAAGFEEVEAQCRAEPACIEARLTDRALAGIAELYERTRAKKRHSGPDLAALRLYRVRSLIAPDLTTSSSVTKTLLFEHAR